MGLSYFQLQFDPSVEWNPGPVQFESQNQKQVYNEIKKLDKKIANASTQRYFLAQCYTNSIIPKDFPSSTILNLAIPDSNMRKFIQKDIENLSPLQKMNVINTQFESTIRQYHEKKYERLATIRSISSPQQLDILQTQLNSLFEKDTHNLQERKTRKFNTLIAVAGSCNSKPNSWIPELGLTETERGYIINNEQICDKTIDAAMFLLSKKCPHLLTQSCSLPANLLVYNPFANIHIHHNGIGQHFAVTSSVHNRIILYDSLNLKPNQQLLDQITSIYSPEKDTTPEVFQCNITNPQIGSIDCGLYAIAYATELIHGFDPAQYVFNQAHLRTHLTNCFENKNLTRFPKSEFLTGKTTLSDITKGINPCNKWSTPKLTAKPKQPTISNNTPTKNRFSPLDADTTNHNSLNPKDLSNIDQLPKQDQQTHTNTHNISTNQTASTQSESSNSPPSSNLPKVKIHKTVINISNRNLSETEISVLELGLTFIPSQKNFNKINVASDVFAFIRRLKLREYFFSKDVDESSNSSNADDDEDRDYTKWTYKNPGWYPDEVRNNRSPNLQKFISDIQEDIRHSLSNNNTKYWNNLSNDQRQALQSLINDQTIIVKPADKGGAIVVMNRNDYEKACTETLQNNEFYEELAKDPSSQYRKEVDDIAQVLKDKNYINNFEQSKLLEGKRIPTFYGLPKVHKIYEKFPPLRPICSGYEACTVTLSEFVDSFLKPAAKKTKTYIKDTTDFICKIKDLKIPSTTNTKSIYLVSMDVASLYPNIDHTEGIDACKDHLNKRKNKYIPTDIIIKLIKIILTSNTMNFLGRFYHQIKGVTMGTPMAVNFSNLFMAKFENNLLEQYWNKHGKKPLLWIRYIDDVFLIWHGDEHEVKHFIKFCNNFSTQNGMKSNIRFEANVSSKSVNFLDVNVKIENGKISTDLYSKSTDAHAYLHHSSYHPWHVIRSLPKSQFIRIRRICSNINDYTKNATEFIAHFSKRGYSVPKLVKIAQEIYEMDRNELLKPKSPHTAKNERVPLVVTYHHKFSNFSKILIDRYKQMISSNPAMKNIFPAPPIISFRRQKSIRDIMVKSTLPIQSNASSSHYTYISNAMNPSTTITNNISQKTATIQPLPPTTSNVIYAGKCKTHGCVYVGQTGQQLNKRYNGHRSDLKHRPYRTELTDHFSQNNCSFESDLEISVLEHVNGGLEKRLQREEYWMSNLDTIYPNGLNRKTGGFNEVYKLLFV